MILNISILSGELVIISSNKLKWYQSVSFMLLITFFVVSIVPMTFFIFNVSNTLSNHFESENKKEALYIANKVAGSIQRSGYLNDVAKREAFEQDRKSVV